MNGLAPLIEPLGWTLVHFLWQGTAIAAVLWVVLDGPMRGARPQARYAAAGAALALMLATAAATLRRQGADGFSDVARHSSGVEVSRSRPSSGQAPPAVATPAQLTAPAAELAPLSPGGVVKPRADGNDLPLARLTAFLPRLFPWLVGLWAAGSCLLSLRVLNSWRLARRLRLGAEVAADAAWHTRFSLIRKRLGVSRSVRLLSSARAAVPMVIGWLKPAVLVPAALFAGLPAPQLEAILAHELAHVRRHDYLVNLLQAVVETLLFYHPAVWWVSAQLRREREHCCDDVASSACGSAIEYARALAVLEETRVSAPVIGVAATGGSLLRRIRRLAGVGEQPTPAAAWPLGLFAFVVLTAAVPLTLLSVAGQPGPSAPRAEAAAAGVTATNQRGQWDLGGGVTLEIKQEVYHATDVSTSVLLRWAATGARPALLHGTGVAQDVFAARKPWAVAWEKDRPVLWIATGDLRGWDDPHKNRKPKASTLRILDFSDPENITDRRLSGAPGNDRAAARVLGALRGLIDVAAGGIEQSRYVQWAIADTPGADQFASIIIIARSDGAYNVGETRCEAAELVGTLKKLAAGNANRSVMIGAVSEVPYAAVITAVAACRDAGLGFSFVRDPEAVSKIGVARGTGRYELAEGIKLQVSQATSDNAGEPTHRINTATIQWYAGNGQLGISWPIELMPGAAIDTIAWERGGTALWILHEHAVRKIDFTNAADVKEQNWKWIEAGDFGRAPPEVRAEIEKSRPPVLQFRLVADTAGPETEPLPLSSDGKDRPSVMNVEKLVIVRVADVTSVMAKPNAGTGFWDIDLRLTDAGGEGLAKASKANIGRALAIVVNGEVLSTPTIRSEIGREVMISGRFSEVEASELVGAMNRAVMSKSRAILLQKNGGILLDDSPVTLEELEQRLRRDFVSNPEVAVILRGDTRTQYQRVMEVLDVVGKVGITQVGLVTQPDDQLSAAEKNGIHIRVLDSTGWTPIQEFRVVAGVKSQISEGRELVNWQPHTVRVGKNGVLDWPRDKAYDEMALRIEADGYAPQVAKWLKISEGARAVKLSLVKDNGITGSVITPTGEPAGGATVALAMVQRDAVIDGGKLRHLGEAMPEKLGDRWRRPVFVRTDEDGRFQLPAESDPTAAVLIVHEDGVREMALADFKKSPEVTLQSWGRIDGRVLWCDKPGGDQPVSLSIHRDRYGYPGVIAQYEKTTSAADGSFVFERVLPGLAQVSCPILVGPNKSGITETNLPGRTTHVTVPPGTTPVLIGGQGRTVKGRLIGRDSWEGVTFHFHPTAPHVGLPGDDEMWKAWGEFQESVSGSIFFRNGLKVAADGMFEIPGVLPGDYQIFFSRTGESGHMATGKFTVGAETPGETPDVRDVGEVRAVPVGR